MPRTARAARGGELYHVMNRGNARTRVFLDNADYSTFVELMHEATRRYSVRVLAVCLMPNHFHLVLRPSGDRDLARWVHWLCTCHARRHHGRHGTAGHVWQGRFKAFPIERDNHLMTVMRYVERNALRANLVDRAEQWPWGSAAWRLRSGELPHAPPIPLPEEWLALVNEPHSEAELVALRRSVNHGTPFGDERWRRRAATRLGLEHTLKPPGRPSGERKGGGK